MINFNGLDLNTHEKNDLAAYGYKEDHQGYDFKYCMFRANMVTNIDTLQGLGLLMLGAGRFSVPYSFLEALLTRMGFICSLVATLPEGRVGKYNTEDEIYPLGYKVIKGVQGNY